METKQDVLERMITQQKPLCPHCGKEMDIWEVPPFTFSDGLGWDSPYLYVCFNDECPLFVNGWNEIMDNYSHKASYRCIKSPRGGDFELMPVFSPMGGKGQIINDMVLAQQEKLKEAIKRGFSALAECWVNKDDVTIVQILLDPSEPTRVRLKAAEMAGDLAGVEAAERMMNHKFGNSLLQEKVDEAVRKIHKRNFTRECPFCAEIIKKRAKICKHCGRDVTGA